MKVKFVRHGQTLYNQECRVMGWIDEPLSKDGMFQVKELAEQLKSEEFDLIFCSPLERARQTAKEINKYQKCPVVYDHRLIERKCGDLDGIKYNELDGLKNWNWIIGDTRCKKYNAETVDNMMERVQDFINYLSEQWPDKKVLIVAHSGIACVLKALQEQKEKGDSILQRGTPNAQLLEFDIQPTYQEERE